MTEDRISRLEQQLAELRSERFGLWERRIDDLRETDTEAAKLAHTELLRRLDGFQERYEINHKALASKVSQLERDALSKPVFETFLSNYRHEQDQASQERRETASVLATATENVRSTVAEERSHYVTEDAYDQRMVALNRQINAVERWQYKLVGGLVFATFVAPLVSALLVYIFTRGV